MEDVPSLLKIPKSKRPDIWIRLPRHKWPKSWSSMEDPVVPLERILCGHLLAGLLWERQFQKVLLEHGWEKAPNWEWLFVNRAKGLFLSVYADDFWLAGKSQHICRQCTHKHCTYSAVQSIHKRGTHRTRLAQELHNIFVRLNMNLSSCPHMAHPLSLSHLPFTTSTSSSSFTHPSTTTPEHALQSGEHDPLQEQPVHHELSPRFASRQAAPSGVKNLQSGGNPRTTTPTDHEPKKLSTVSRILGIIDPYQSSDVQNEFEHDHRAPITEEVQEFGEIGTHGLPDSEISERRPTSNRTCTSTIPWKALEILISKMESYKRCWLHHCRPRKLRWNPTHWPCMREGGKCTIDSSWKRKFEVSFAWRPESFWETQMHCFHLSRETGSGVLCSETLIRRGSLLEGNKDHLLNQARSDLAKRELHVESLNKCIGELQRQTEEQRLALQDSQHGFVESRREHVRLQEELSIKEKVLRNTQIRNVHQVEKLRELKNSE